MNIYVQSESSQQGPYTLEEVSAYVANGTFSKKDLAWVEGTPIWRPIADLLDAPKVSHLRSAEQRAPEDISNAVTSGILRAVLIMGAIASVLFLTFWILKAKSDQEKFHDDLQTLFSEAPRNFGSSSTKDDVFPFHQTITITVSPTPSPH